MGEASAKCLLRRLSSAATTTYHYEIWSKLTNATTALTTVNLNLYSWFFTTLVYYLTHSRPSKGFIILKAGNERVTNNQSVSALQLKIWQQPATYIAAAAAKQSSSRLFLLFSFILLSVSSSSAVCWWCAVWLWWWQRWPKHKCLQGTDKASFSPFFFLGCLFAIISIVTCRRSRRHLKHKTSKTTA